MSAASWLDNRLVTFLTSQDTTTGAENGFCFRKGKVDRCSALKIRVAQPGCAKDYSRYMFGVDLQYVLLPIPL